MTLDDPKRQRTLVAALMAAMAATRYQHFGSAIDLPDASLAIFFLAGFYLPTLRFFPLLLLEAAIIDYLATQVGGVSDWCLSPAYWFLIPTYAALWYGGRWYAMRHRLQWRAALPLSTSLFFSATVAFLISNGSFYLFSGRFPDLSWSRYAGRVAQYYAPYLSSAFGYVIFAAIIHVLFITMRGVARPAPQPREMRD